VFSIIAPKIRIGPETLIYKKGVYVVMVLINQPGFTLKILTPGNVRSAIFQQLMGELRLVG
jgi:hypothetical protein